MAPVQFRQMAIKIKPGCFLRTFNDTPHSQVDTINLSWTGVFPPFKNLSFFDPPPSNL